METIFEEEISLISILKKRIELQHDIKRELLREVSQMKSNIQSIYLPNSFKRIRNDEDSDVKNKKVRTDQTTTRLNEVENYEKNYSFRCDVTKTHHDSYQCPVAIFGLPDPRSITMYPKSRVYVNNQMDRQLEEIRAEEYEKYSHSEKWKNRQKVLEVKQRQMFLCPNKIPEEGILNRRYMFPGYLVYPGFGQDVSLEEIKLIRKKQCGCYRQCWNSL